MQARHDSDPERALRGASELARDFGADALEQSGLQLSGSARPAALIESVSLAFRDGTRALDGVSLGLRRGEFVALVGPSGCGKSSLLRLIAGFEAPSAGRIQLASRAVGYVFQDATLLPWLNVEKNVGLPTELEGVPRSQRRALVAAALGRVGLEGFERHRPAELSGGMRMRVSIARALTLRPELFLFDEPFGALDEITRERLHEQLVSMFVAEPFAGLFVTHSVPEAVFLATRVIVMSPRPGRFAAEFAVPFAYPRAPELRYSAEFARLAGNVSAALREVSQ